MGTLETAIALKKQKEIHSNLKSLKYKSNDVRLEYYQYMSTIYDRFHKGLAYIDFIKEIADNRLLKDTILENESYRFLLDDYLVSEKMKSHFSDNSRRFLIDSWSVFEWTLTQLLYHLMDESEITKFLQKEFLAIKVIIEEEIPKSETKNKIYKKLEDGQFIKKHITHQSITRRSGRIFSLIKQKYSRDINCDKEFLSFLGTYRNGLHYNFVYSGNKRLPFIFDNLIFKFIDDEPIQTPNEPWELRIINNLVDITNEIILSIDTDFIQSKIKYPT